jgi:hypothetical protein
MDEAATLIYYSYLEFKRLTEVVPRLVSEERKQPTCEFVHGFAKCTGPLAISCAFEYKENS